MTRVLLHMHRFHESGAHGIQRYARELAAELPAPGWAFEFWTGREDEGVDVDPGVRVIEVPRRPLHALWLFTGRPRLERFTGPTELVHEMCPAFPVPTQAPLVMTVHDVLPLQNPEWYTPREVWSFQRTVRHAVRHGADLIVPSEAVRADLLEAHPDLAGDHVHVVAEGVSPALVGASDDASAARLLAELAIESGRYVVALGEVRARKNLEVVFRALRTMDQPPAFVVVGAAGPQSEGTYAAVDLLGVGGIVRLAGRRTDEEVKALLDHALALVHPAFYEGFGLPPVEAMARGVPTVVTTGGSLPEVAAGASLLADPRSPADWASQIGRLVSDPDLVADLRSRGLARAAELTWTSAAERTRAVYEVALGRR